MTVLWRSLASRCDHIKLRWIKTTSIKCGDDKDVKRFTVDMVLIDIDMKSTDGVVVHADILVSWLKKKNQRLP